MEETTVTSVGPADLNGASGMPDEVSRIRDIIFGANMRDYERRFSTLEAHLLQELASLRSDMLSRFDQAAAAASAEFGRLHERVTNEVQQLNARLSSEAQQLHGRVTSEVQQLNDRLQDERDARNASVQDLHDALQRARDAADERAGELQALLEHRASELREGKTDRHQLGDLLRQLGDSLQAPAADSRG